MQKNDFEGNAHATPIFPAPLTATLPSKPAFGPNTKPAVILSPEQLDVYADCKGLSEKILIRMTNNPEAAAVFKLTDKDNSLIYLSVSKSREPNEYIVCLKKFESGTTDIPPTNEVMVILSFGALHLELHPDSAFAASAAAEPTCSRAFLPSRATDHVTSAQQDTDSGLVPGRSIRFIQ
ncbi:MAG: hypothetical protein V4490_08235 [Pseudomonadota bacterium]